MGINEARGKILSTNFQRDLDELLEQYGIKISSAEDEASKNDTDLGIEIQSAHSEAMSKIIELVAETYVRIGISNY